MKRRTAAAANFNSKFLTVLLNAAGIDLASQTYAKYVHLLKYYLLYAFVLLTSGQILLLRHLRTLEEITITLVFINCGIYLNGMTLILHLKKRYMINVYESIERDFVEFASATAAVATTTTTTATTSNAGNASSSDVRFKRFVIRYGIPGVTVYAFSVSGTVLLFPFSGKRYDDINALSVPSVFPWRVDTALKYVLTNALQFSWVGVLSVPVMLNFMFGIYYMIEIRSQYDILCESVQRLDTAAGKYDGRTERVILHSFGRCIRHHQAILKFSRNFNGCYNAIFAANLIYTVPSTALSLLSIVEEKSFSTIMRNAMTLTAATIYLLLFTSIGQTVQNANDRFRNALLNLKWYANKSIKFRKTYLIVLNSTERVFSLQASNKYVASNELFYDILKLSYSYYNIINKAFSR